MEIEDFNKMISKLGLVVIVNVVSTAPDKYKRHFSSMEHL